MNKQRYESLERFMTEVKSLLRNMGKSNIIWKNELDELINKYDINVENEQ